jgi:uncharacterized protein YdbL (DUF1318 family)
MNITADNVSAIMHITFGFNLDHYLGLIERGNTHKESVKDLYELRCMAYYLYRNKFGATLENVAEMLGVSARFVQNSLIFIDAEKAELNRNLNP